jgi:hypothetical protein
MSDIEARLARLEAEADIRRLKARYLNACDAKQADRVRACFTEDAALDYGPLGKFGVDGLIDVFTRLAVQTPIADSHQGHNGEIDLIDADTAKGIWSLAFITYDPKTQAFRSTAGFYHDEYRRTADGWRVCKSTFAPRITVSGTLTPDGVSATPLQPVLAA